MEQNNCRWHFVVSVVSKITECNAAAALDRNTQSSLLMQFQALMNASEAVVDASDALRNASDILVTQQLQNGTYDCSFALLEMQQWTDMLSTYKKMLANCTLECQVCLLLIFVLCLCLTSVLQVLERENRAGSYAIAPT